MVLYLMRHGETIHNREKKYSTDDNPLSQEGKNQARAAGKKIPILDLDEVWVSPLARTGETFDLACRDMEIPFRYVDDLREIDAGKFKGLTFDQGQALYPEATDLYLKDYINKPLPGGETIREAYGRAGRLLEDIRKADKNILAISHGGLIGLILAHMEGDLDHYYSYGLANCQIVRVDLEKGEFNKI